MKLSHTSTWNPTISEDEIFAEFDKQLNWGVRTKPSPALQEVEAFVAAVDASALELEDSKVQEKCLDIIYTVNDLVIFFAQSICIKEMEKDQDLNERIYVMRSALIGYLYGMARAERLTPEESQMALNWLFPMMMRAFARSLEVETDSPYYNMIVMVIHLTNWYFKNRAKIHEARRQAHFSSSQ